MQKNLIQMDEKTKGLKQLNSSVQRIQDNFAANGYELVEMLGKDYNEGLKATVNFVQDEDFEDGKRIITRIIKPQVNYKGTMIQTAQIEVTEA
jgi:transketolase N-terminal domain/subunit